MANFYTDLHGQGWGVMMQEKQMSCGPASVAMTKVYYTSSITADLEAETRRISQSFPGGFNDVTGSNISNLVQVLRQEGVQTYDEVCAPSVWSYIYNYASSNTPLIAHIAWQGGGGHFVVCANVYKDDQLCIFLDPFYGLVQIVGSQLPNYVVQDPTGNFGPVATGSLSGWIAVTHT
jgi:hypothetical protein